MVSVSKGKIVKGLRNLGVKQGDALLVHSSLKSFGLVEGGAETVIDALLEAVGPEGTVMVPTLTGQESYCAQNPPVFDVADSVCFTGTIPETFRKRKEAIRSLHPTHSVSAIGLQSVYLIKDHLESETPCGPGSPYMKLAELDGKVVFFGIGLECCTLLHGVEEIAGCEYHLQTLPAEASITDADKTEFKKHVLIHQYGTPRQFTRLEPEFLEKNIMKKGLIGQAEVRVLQAKPAVEITLKILKTQPGYLCKD